MSILLEQLEQLLQTDRPVCFAILVETHGATPQKPGVTVLISNQGASLGIFRGQAVDTHIKQKAAEWFEEVRQSVDDRAGRATFDVGYRNAELVTLSLDGGQANRNPPGGNGELTILFVPLAPVGDRSYFQCLRDELAAGRGCTEVAIVDAIEAGGGCDGDLFLVDGSGTVVATRSAVAGELPPANLIPNLKLLAERPQPFVLEGLSFLPHVPRCRLIVIGAGDLGQKVAALAADVDFDIWVVDDGRDRFHSNRFPFAKRVISDELGTALRSLEIDAHTYCVIVTRHFPHDEQALLELAESSATYLGMIGNRGKVQRIFENLLRQGISREALDRVHAPVGFDIGSQTVNEIAISIVAELIAHRNLGRRERSV